MRVGGFVRVALCALGCSVIGQVAWAAGHPTVGRPLTPLQAGGSGGPIYVVTTATGNSSSISGSTGPITVTQTSGPVIVGGDWGSHGWSPNTGDTVPGSGAAPGNGGGGSLGLGLGIGLGVDAGGGVSVSTGANVPSGGSGEVSNGPGTSTAARNGLVTVNLGSGTGAAGSQGGLVNLNLGSGAAEGGLLTANIGTGQSSRGLVDLSLGTSSSSNDNTPETPHRTALQLCGGCLIGLTGGVGG